MEQNTIRTLIIENTHLWRGVMDFGWGNGYVVIPIGHPLHGKNYNDIDGINIHGGLTFSEPVSELKTPVWKKCFSEDEKDAWVIGFDTAHGGDTLEYWTPQRVQEEANRLLEQVKNYNI